MPNRLIHSASPYLLQHAHNPVDWFPWGNEALEKAKKENKLLLISIGYSACHWCHVMERECFENEEVARLMNENFVNIKVDREERPDIDHLYMDAVMIMSRRGGWPLNCIALPDGRPVFGGTYFPKQGWMEVLGQLSLTWKSDPDKVEEYGVRMAGALKDSGEISFEGESEAIKRIEVEGMIQGWMKRMDKKEGGEQRAPKFPMPVNWKFLQEAGSLFKNNEILEHVDLTLKKIALGGIFDAVGGGFARYSVDERWHIPHFEKMLYDNAQLISLYSNAFLRNPRPLYKETVERTITFLIHEFRSPEGAFYSALDADSEGVEGKFYVWTESVLHQLLENEAPLFIEYYNVLPSGNWEHGNNVLIASEDVYDFSAKRNLNPVEVQASLQHSWEILLEEREKRIRPGLDDKVLTSWNALLTRGLIDAANAFNNPGWLRLAEENAIFFEQHLIHEGRLDRVWKNGVSSVNAFLDDYALLADAWIALFQATGNIHWLHQAESLVNYSRKHFLEEGKDFFFYSSALDPVVVVRKVEVNDNVIPSANAMMAHNLFMIGKLLDKDEFIFQSQRMLSTMKPSILQFPGSFSFWASFSLKFIFPFFEVVVTGPNSIKILEELKKKFIPNVILLGSVEKKDLPLFEGRHSDSETRIFVCQNKSCRLPVSSIEEALQQIISYEVY